MHDRGEGSSYDSVDFSDDESEYEEVLHPNQERAGTNKQKRIYRGCAKYLNRFDELIMKPIFIYKYEKDMQKKSKEFFDLFMKEGDTIEKEFLKENMAHQHTLANDEDGHMSANKLKEKNTPGGFNDAKSNPMS